MAVGFETTFFYCLNFTPIDIIRHPLRKGLAALVRDGILVGYNNILDPDGKFNMQQAAVVVYKIYNNTLQ